jgi:branched-chain amino acid aminotransferase
LKVTNFPKTLKMLNDLATMQSNGIFPHEPALSVSSGLTKTSTSLSELNASDIKITLTQNPKVVPAPGSPEERSQKVCTDHMVSALWTAEKGWARPELTPYGPLSLMPTANVLHYATECFEGMKLYRGFDSKLRLFRPDANCIRMLNSARRISLPEFDPKELLKMVQKLCAVDGPKWLPKYRPGTFLYIRPAMIGTDSCLGFEVPKEALLYVIISYWPQPANPTMGKGLRLFASREDTVRAWPGGTGYAKIGPNYGPALLAHGEAKRMGYDQVLWLFGPDCQITEAGSSNVFVIWRSQPGNLQMVTAPLSEKTILAGVTRQSVLYLAKERFAAARKFDVEDVGSQQVEALEVLERNFTMAELISALEEGKLLATFIVGTAAFVAPVSQINFRGREINIGTEAVPHVSLLRQWISDMMYGKASSEWANIVEEE